MPSKVYIENSGHPLHACEHGISTMVDDTTGEERLGFGMLVQARFKHVSKAESQIEGHWNAKGGYYAIQRRQP